jgi:molybdopterin synthase sulfur carrier subunit
MSDERELTVMYFGLLSERRGLASERVAVAATTPRELYAQLNESHGLGLAPEHFRVAVNDAFADWDAPLAAGDTVAFLPPMSGG